MWQWEVAQTTLEARAAAHPTPAGPWTKQALETAKGLQNYSSTKQIPEAKLDKQSEYALNKYLQENKNSNKNSHVNSQVYVDVLNDGEK